ncbi:MAG: SET domain-containing protein [Cyanobacteria bacterium SID2]|nr:SET domain-containing protein [Cyanobacteria bacterium SID2]MBP0002195.1 SET domain-containing protein [Cyanobacteria bacterium SBC]
MSLDTISDVEVRPAGQKGLGVFATRNFRPGETVVVGRRVCVLPHRTIYSIQVDWNVHVEIDEPAVRINHAYEPNTGVRDNQWGAYDFIALREIEAGEEITFDYETTESEFTEDFQRCCPPRLERNADTHRGFQSIPPEVRAKYGEFIANYLKAPSDAR